MEMVGGGGGGGRGGGWTRRTVRTESIPGRILEVLGSFIWRGPTLTCQVMSSKFQRWLLVS